MRPRRDQGNRAGPGGATQEPPQRAAGRGGAGVFTASSGSVGAEEPKSASPQQARHAGELLRNEVARAAAEARAWVGRGPDMPEARDLSKVPGSRGQRAPEEVLVEFCGATVWVASQRIGVVSDEVARGDY